MAARQRGGVNASRRVPVEHAGNAAASAEEAAAVAAEIEKMVGGSWTDMEGEEQPLRPKDFMVVAPYNAQVRPHVGGIVACPDAAKTAASRLGRIQVPESQAFPTLALENALALGPPIR